MSSRRTNVLRHNICWNDTCELLSTTRWLRNQWKGLTRHIPPDLKVTRIMRKTQKAKKQKEGQIRKWKSYQYCIWSRKYHGYSEESNRHGFARILQLRRKGGLESLLLEVTFSSLLLLSPSLRLTCRISLKWRWTPSASAAPSGVSFVTSASLHFVVHRAFAGYHFLLALGHVLSFRLLGISIDKCKQLVKVPLTKSTLWNFTRTLCREYRIYILQLSILRID